MLGAEIAEDYKPTIDVYLASARALNLSPERVVRVAAHNADLSAAAEAGLQTAFLPRPQEHGPMQMNDLKAEDDWTYVAKDLVDLATQVACAPDR